MSASHKGSKSVPWSLDRAMSIASSEFPTYVIVDKLMFRSMSEEIQRLNGELGKANAHTQVLMRSTEEIMQGKDQELQHLRINVKHNIDRVMQLEGEKRELEGKNRELEGEKSECINQIVIFADKFNAAHLNLKATEAKLDATEQSLVAMEAKLNATEQSLVATEAKLNATGTKLTATEGKLKSTEAALESAQQFLMYQLNQNEILQYAVNGNKEQLIEAEKQIEELQANASSIDAFKEQLASNKVQLKEAEKALEDAKRQIQDLKEGNQEMSKKNKEFKKKTEKLEKENSSLKIFEAEYKKQLDASVAIIKRYTDAETAFDKQMRELRIQRGLKGPTDPASMALCVMTLLNQARRMLEEFCEKKNLGVDRTLKAIEQAIGPAPEVRSEPTARRGRGPLLDYVFGE